MSCRAMCAVPHFVRQYAHSLAALSHEVCATEQGRLIHSIDGHASSVLSGPLKMFSSPASCSDRHKIARFAGLGTPQTVPVYSCKHVRARAFPEFQVSRYVPVDPLRRLRMGAGQIPALRTADRPTRVRASQGRPTEAPSSPALVSLPPFGCPILPRCCLSVPSRPLPPLSSPALSPKISPLSCT